MDSNVHHREAWTKSRWGMIGNTRIGRGVHHREHQDSFEASPTWPSLRAQQQSDQIVYSWIGIHQFIASKNIIEEFLVVAAPPITTVFAKHRLLTEISPQIVDWNSILISSQRGWFHTFPEAASCNLIRKPLWWAAEDVMKINVEVSQCSFGQQNKGHEWSLMHANQRSIPFVIAPFHLWKENTSPPLKICTSTLVPSSKHYTHISTSLVFILSSTQLPFWEENSPCT